MDTRTYFLVDDGKSMPRWCQLVPARDGDGLAWIDFKARTWPHAAARPLAHVEGPDQRCTIAGVSPEVAGMVRSFAERHLLDPWSDPGWLSPEGRFYVCAYYAHDDIAQALLGRFVGDLEYEGYVRVHADVFLVSPMSARRDPTTRQSRTLERLGFDVETRRRAPYAADRSLPPPGFAVKPRYRPAAPAPSLQPDIRVDNDGVAPLLARLRTSEPLAFLFDAEDPELVTELGGGNWDWLLHFPQAGLDLGTGETLRDLREAPGLYLHSPAPGHVEMFAWHAEGMHVSSASSEALDGAARYMPRPR